MFKWILSTTFVLLVLGLVACAGMWIVATAAAIMTDISLPLGFGVLMGGIAACSMVLAGLLHAVYRPKKEKGSCANTSACCSSSSHSSQ